jgi:hypothetical protein
MLLAFRSKAVLIALANRTGLRRLPNTQVAASRRPVSKRRL